MSYSGEISVGGVQMTGHVRAGGRLMVGDVRQVIRGEPFTYEDFTAAQLVALTGPAGPVGTLFTPSVDAEGNLSWSNDGGLMNPQPVNIRGPQGLPGQDGAAGVPGPQGENGADGAPGPMWTPTCSPTDLTAGVSPLAEGEVYIVYE